MPPVETLITGTRFDARIDSHVLDGRYFSVGGDVLIEGARLLRAQRHFIRRSDSGFTLMELMGVVAIIAIVMAVAFPAAMSIRSNLRAMELNAKAQQVYNQVQSRLTSLQTDGSLGDLETDLGSAKKLADAPTAPVAYQYANGKTTDWSKYGMYEVASGDSAVTNYLVTSGTSLGASGNLTGSYIIELSPSTGEVYAVYYWEGDVSGSTGFSTISTQTTDQLTANHIGYYGGKSIDPAITHKNVTQFSDLGFSLVNKEELYARIISSDFSKTVFDPSKLSVTIKVTGTPSSFFSTGSWSETFQGGDSPDEFKVNASTNEVDIILDSMREDLDFYTITGGQILPGSDIDVSVSVTYNGNTYDASNRTGMQTKSDNSLFGTGSFALTASTTANVSAVRHLNNLRSQRNGLQWSIAKVSQTGDIDFDGADWTTTPECVSVQSRKAQSDNSWNPLTQFTPIDNANYNVNWGGRTFDGASHKIKNFVIVGSGNLTGLFPSSWIDFSNVFMTDTKVTGTGIYTGGLVGLVYSGTLTNCHNDVTKTDADGKLLLADHAVTGTWGCVGGLVGEIDSSSTVTNCSATTNVTSTYGSYVGGLIGWLRGGGSKIADCSVGSESGVATVSGYGAYVGGMVGKHDGSGGLSGCSAFANVNATSVYGAYAGGLVGYLINGGAPISQCSVGSETSPVTVTCYGSYVGGVVGNDLAAPSSPALEDCTAFANVTSTNGGLVGGLAGQVSQTTTVSNCAVGSAKTAVTIAGASDGVGGLIGQSNAQTVSGCAVVANVSGDSSYVGGVIGNEKNTSMTLDKCSEGVGAATDPKNAVTVSGAGYVGGLCGIFCGGSLTNSDAVANIISTDDYAGGLCGSSTKTWATIDTCHFDAGLTTSTGRIIAVNSTGNYVGGLVGSLAGGTTLKNCTVGSGGNVLLQVNGSTYTGGAIGYSSNATVSDASVLCTSVASDYYYVGGFVGLLSAGSATNCHAVGNPDYDDNSGGRSSVSTTAVATGYGFLGGFAGQLGSCIVSSCYADSNVIGSGCAYVGGFVGVAGGGEISSCYASGQVQGYTSAGGFVGRCNTSSIHDCFSTSDVLGSANVGGFFGSIYSSYTYYNDTSYGRVCLANGGTPSGASGFGGFVGYNSGRTNSGNFGYVKYLVESCCPATLKPNMPSCPILVESRSHR